MTATAAARYLYLARHGEATPDESELTDTGRRQAVLLGERLAGAALSVVHHGPLPRAARTAALIGERLDGVPVRESDLAGDYVPYLPRREELPADSADAMLERLAAFPAEEREGPGGPGRRSRGSPARWRATNPVTSWSSPTPS